MSKAVYTVYDIETTGLSAACQCEIIEFAGIKYDEDLNEIDRLHIYVKPYKKLPKKIVELTGITNEQLAGCENRFQVLPKIRSFIGDTISVCHNANFDHGFISTMCVLQGLPILKSYICTLKSYKAITGEKSGKLFMACEKFGITLENAHTAIADAEATAKLFKKLKELDNDEVISKMFLKTYDEKDYYLSIMANIAAQNPNKKIRDAVCNCVIPNEIAQLDIDIVFDAFSHGKDPNAVCQLYNYSNDDVSLLFALWLNNQRLPKFIFLEDFSLNRQIKTMVGYADDLIDMYRMHKTIYGDATINRGIYNYFWIKLRHNDRTVCNTALTTLFINKYPIEKILSNFPHVNPSDITLAFCKFAEISKNDYREYIANTIVSKNELTNAVNNDKVHFSDTEIKNNPELINLAITCALYERNFFKTVI